MKNNNFFKLIRYTLFAILFVVDVSYANTQHFDHKINLVKSLLATDHKAAKLLLSELELKSDEFTQGQKGELLIWKGVSHIYLGEHQKAISFLKSAEELVNTVENLALVYSFLMTSHLGEHNYQSALKAAKKQIKVIDHLVDPSIQRDLYVRMVNFYYNLGAYSESQRYVHKALKLVENPNTTEHCLLQVSLAMNDLELNNESNLKKSIQLVINLCQKVEYKFGVAISHRIFGQVLAKSGALVKAERAYLKALEIYNELNHVSEIKNVESHLAEIHFKKNEFSLAKKKALIVLRANDNLLISNAKKQSYRILADIYSQEGKYKEAYNASQQAQKYQQLIYDNEKIKTLAYEAAKFDFEELEDFIQKNENTTYISSGRELRQIDKEMDLIYDKTILQYLLLLFGTTVFTSTYAGVSSYRRNRYNKLTGLLRHDAASRKSKDFFHDAMYRKNGFAVIAIDIDQLKDINRILGHERADWVLTIIADAIKSFTQFKKAFGSYNGGGSFYVFLEIKQNQNVIKIAENLVEHFDNCNTAESLKLFRMTVSVGVATLMHRIQGVNEKEMCRRADVALHAAKECKGNEIISYQESFDAEDSEHTKQMQFVQFIDPKLMVSARML